MKASADLPGEEPLSEDDPFILDASSDSYDGVAAEVTLSAGLTLCDRYEVRYLARRGGMGAIYRGADLNTGKPVAIKVMSCLGRAVRARFLRETRILSELSHPGIVRHLSHGTTPDGTLFLVMEWLEGEDLSERLARQPLTLDESLMLLRYACQALEVAHARGIVHRDIKPANLFLTSSDPRSVKILDFGIARLVVAAPELTTGGALLGTVGYMAPEQAMGQRDLDPRADVFALGCVLYECVTGRAPFASSDQVAVLAKVLREDPPRPSDVRPGIDRRVDELCLRMIEKKREDRPANVAAVLAELLRIDVEPAETLFAHELSQTLRGSSEQRIISVILGKSSDAGRGATRSIDETLCDLADKFGAEVAPLKGGGLLLMLTGRGEANDRASQAASCALELRKCASDLTLAVATGLAETSGRAPVGPVIDRAAALLAAAKPGSVVLDDVTTGLVGLRFEIERGVGANVLLAARRELDAARLLMGRRTPHVGRDRELSMLDGVLDECVAERVSRIVIVTGAPGMGKSRLAGEWLGRGGRSGGVKTLFARGDPGSAALAVIEQLIRDAAGLREADPRELQRERLRDYLLHGLEDACNEQFLTFVSEAVGVSPEREPSPILRAARGDPELMREQTRRALHAWLDAETARQPVLLVIEDLHWADAPSVAFLTEALRADVQRPLMLLALARPEVERQFPELHERAALCIRLLGLSSRAAQELVFSALESRPTDSVVARLIRTADGNPLYLEELIRRVASGDTHWPDTVLAMAQSRIERLGPEQRLVLRVASVFGETCWDLGVQAVLDADIDVKERLEGLVDEELLVRVSDSRYPAAREYRFRHALLRDATYATFTDAHRAVAHDVASVWLEQNGETDARLLADHCEAAGQAERARLWLGRAAKAAIDAGDLVGTSELADRGVGLGAEGLERGRFLLLRCFAEALRGEPNLKVSREALDLLKVGTAPWWLGLGILIFGSCMRGRPQEAGPYVALAAEAPFESERDAPLGQGLLTLVGGLVLLGKSDIAERILERAGALPEDPVFGAFLQAARTALASVAPINGKWQLQRAFHEGRRSVEALGALGAVHGQSIALYYFGIAAMHLGRYEEARDACLRSAELTRKGASGVNEGWPLLFLARAYLRLGQLEAAQKAVQPILSLSDWTVRQMLPVVIAEARFREGNFAAAEEAAREACTGVSPRLARLAASLLTRAQLAQGRAADALSSSERALRLPTSNGLESEIDLLTVRAEALHESGRHAEALEALARARRAISDIADDITDPALKTSFLKNVDPCARAEHLARTWNVDA